MELEELQVGELGARAVGQQHPAAQRPGGVRRTRPQRCRAARTDNHRPRANRAAVLAGQADAATIRDHQCVGPSMLEDLDQRLLCRERRELTHHAPAGRAAAGVHDPAQRVASLEPEREGAAAIRVEVHPETLEVADASRSLCTEDLRGGAAHEAAPGALGVGAVALRAVVAGQCGGQPALGPVAGRLGERGGRDQSDARTIRRRAERGVETGGAGADHRELGLDWGGG